MNEESDLGHSDWSSGPNNLNPEIGSDTVSQSLAKHDLIKYVDFFIHRLLGYSTHLF